MGFRKASKTFQLTWPEGDDNHGLEVRMRSLPVRKLMALGHVQDEIATGKATADSLAALFQIFAGALIEWNLEDEKGDPVPATLEGVENQDGDFITSMITAWMGAFASVPPPLPDGSNSGGTSPVESTLELASSSQSLQS